MENAGDAQPVSPRQTLGTLWRLPLHSGRSNIQRVSRPSERIIATSGPQRMPGKCQILHMILPRCEIFIYRVQQESWKAKSTITILAIKPLSGQDGNPTRRYDGYVTRRLLTYAHRPLVLISSSRQHSLLFPDWIKLHFKKDKVKD